MTENLLDFSVILRILHQRIVIHNKWKPKFHECEIEEKKFVFFFVLEIGISTKINSKWQQKKNRIGIEHIFTIRDYGLVMSNWSE